MKKTAKVTVKIYGLLQNPLEYSDIMRFDCTDNIFGRIYKSRHYFMKKFNIGYEQLEIINVEWLD